MSFRIQQFLLSGGNQFLRDLLCTANRLRHLRYRPAILIMHKHTDLLRLCQRRQNPRCHRLDFLRCIGCQNLRVIERLCNRHIIIFQPKVQILRFSERVRFFLPQLHNRIIRDNIRKPAMEDLNLRYLRDLVEYILICLLHDHLRLRSIPRKCNRPRKLLFYRILI